MADYDSMTFGATAWGLKLFGPDDVASFREVAPKISNLPFGRKAGSIEIFAPMAEEGYDAAMSVAPQIKRIAKINGLKAYACGFNPYTNPDGSENPHLVDQVGDNSIEAIARIKRGLDFAAAIAEPEQGMLTGPWQMRHKFLGIKPQDTEILIDILKTEIAPYAEELKVRAAFEPLQMDEGYLPNPGIETIDVAIKVDSPYIGINGDTKHLAFGRGPGGEVEDLSLIYKGLLRAANYLCFI